ncbi:hypothetical protein LBMAG42_40600 [Deltaproteobacteria bacterium]|nr:hypothetical protein LBMAG42_40600 [Deltaproteobacteria bacterium]
MLLSLLIGCPAPQDSAEPAPVGALGLGRQNPFPSVELVGADGFLALEAGDLPQKEGGTQWEFSAFAAREGFSVVQPSIAQFESPIDPESVGGQEGIATDGTVRLVDLDSGEALWCFAELDAASDVPLDSTATLIVRPMQTLTPGHRVAVVVTSAVTSGGAPLAVPEAEGHYAELRAELEALGQTDVTVAWDFPVAGGSALLDHTLALTTATPTAHSFTRTWEAGSGTEPPPGVWRMAEGSFTTVELLVDGERMELSADRTPKVQGAREAYLMVVIPEAVKDAAPGTVPILVFGHGIMSEPSDYLAEDDDPNGLLNLANTMGAIVIATKWTGLTEDDRLHAINVADDFARFDEIPEMLAQGVSDTLALVRAAGDGALFEDALFGGLADPSRIYYYGISLGGIEGAVMLSQQSTIERGVLHVGGAAWATMLERSAQWPPFDLVVTRNFPDPWDRQVLYAATQVLWDPVDPASYTAQLAADSRLWQESVGDEQVPNLTTELLMRSVGVTLATPAVNAPVGLNSEAMPFTGSAMTQFDPEEALPDPVNRPAVLTGAHSTPRLWPGAQAQTIHFLETGEVAHFCGEAACSASNPGSF